MSASFVTELRTRRAPLVLGPPSDRMLRVRAQVLEAWDAVTIDANPKAKVSELKMSALAELYPDVDADEFVVKLHGFEVLDEEVSLVQAGAKDGSIFLVADRHRRPVQ